MTNAKKKLNIKKLYLFFKMTINLVYYFIDNFQIDEIKEPAVFTILNKNGFSSISYE